jgi:hypothetical protein
MVKWIAGFGVVGGVVCGVSLKGLSISQTSLQRSWQPCWSHSSLQGAGGQNGLQDLPYDKSASPPLYDFSNAGTINGHESEP